jgi:hypothetical protein
LSNTVTTSLALKADKTEVTNLSNIVTTSLALKAEKTTVDELLARVVTIEEKLGTIARGAEVNVQADFGVTDQNNDAYIKGKPATAVSDILYKGFIAIRDISDEHNKYLIEFPSLSTSNYMVLGSFKSKSTNPKNEDNITWAWTNQTTNQFDLWVREVIGDHQTAEFHYVIIAL